jgi:hypothetical protein
MTPGGLKYDHDLHMLIVPPQPINLSYLKFLRYLGERGRLEHEIAGPVSGELVTVCVEQVAMQSPDYSGKAA